MKRFTYSLILCCFFISSALGQQTIGLFENDSLSYNGYTLIAGEYTKTYLIDNCGFVVNSWEAEQRPGNSVYLLENGNLLRTGNISGNFNAGGRGGRIELFSWEGDLLWRYDYASPGFHQHHDVAWLPNGNILLIAWQYRTSQNAINNGRDPDLTSPNGVWSEQIVELEPVGTDQANIVWRWDLWDHLIQDFDSTKLNYGVVADHPELVDINYSANFGGGTSSGSDWVHMNAINYNEALDQIVVSSRHFDEFWIIDHSTKDNETDDHEGGNAGKGGDLLYRWGNPQTYKRGDIEDKVSFGQHDVQWIPEGLPGAGNIMFFNNGAGRPDGEYSSIDIISPPMEGDWNYVLNDASPYGPDEAFYSFTTEVPEDFYSVNVSGVQRLANGNTLICNGRRGLLFEITPEEEIVWEYQCPVRTGTGPLEQETDISNVPTVLFRAYRYGEDYPAFEGKDLTPGDPIELNPLPSDCMIFENPVSSSELFELEGISILENPGFHFLKLKNETGSAIDIEIVNLNGQAMDHFISQDNIIEKEIASWPAGLYILNIIEPLTGKRFIGKFVKH